MTKLKLEIQIKAPIKRCFDLARSIDLHQISTPGTNEKAIAGITTGLINEGETVTWKAKHFGITQTLTSEITKLDAPNLFIDEMTKGAFKSIHHTHKFTSIDGVTIMSDVLDYQVPGGIIGRMVDKCLIKKHLTKLLESRNEIIKEYAESNKWKTIPGINN